MPSGRTHDRITLWSLPVVAGLTFGLTRSGNITLLVSGGFFFSGLMFGPDLDIHSRQFIRWGWLRWLWIPYQKTLRHRSMFSHGPIIGTSLRLIYLATWLSLVGILGLVIAQRFGRISWDWEQAMHGVMRSLSQHSSEWIALFIGLELGAMSHSLSDWGGSAYKRFQRRGLSGLIAPSAKKKRRSRSTTKGKAIQRPVKTPKTPRKKKTAS